MTNLQFCSLLLLLLAIASKAVFFEEYEKMYVKTILLAEPQFQKFIQPNVQFNQNSIPTPEAYLLPVIFIWDPLTQFTSENAYRCPEHDGELAASSWMDGSCNSRLPRLLYDSDGQVLFIGRIYRCTVGQHYIRSTDIDLLNYYSQFQDTPFRLTHSQAFTVSFIDDLMTAVSNGISFNRFQGMYLEKILNNHYQSEKRFWNEIIRKQVAVARHDQIDATFKKKLATLEKSFPSDDTLCDIFLRKFEEDRAMYEEDIESISAAGLMADHTFKVRILIFNSFSPS